MLPSRAFLALHSSCTSERPTRSNHSPRRHMLYSTVYTLVISSTSYTGSALGKPSCHPRSQLILILHPSTNLPMHQAPTRHRNRHEQKPLLNHGWSSPLSFFPPPAWSPGSGTLSRQSCLFGHLQTNYHNHGCFPVSLFPFPLYW